MLVRVSREPLTLTADTTFRTVTCRPSLSDPIWTHEATCQTDVCRVVLARFDSCIQGSDIFSLQGGLQRAVERYRMKKMCLFIYCYFNRYSISAVGPHWRPVRSRLPKNDRRNDPPSRQFWLVCLGLKFVDNERSSLFVSQKSDMWFRRVTWNL